MFTSSLITSSPEWRPFHYFFHSPVEELTQRTWSLLRETRYAIKLISTILSKPSHRYHYCNEEIVWKKESKGLYVLVHGLYGFPQIWNHHLDRLKNERDIDVFVPRVPHQGDCTLEEAAEPILNQVKKYLEQHPNQPICFLGISNGGRITLWMEERLRKLFPEIPIAISNVVGAHLGSPQMDKVTSNPLLRSWFYRKETQTELSLNSQVNRNLIAAVKEPFSGIRRYSFYASMHDCSVPELKSSCPNLGKGEESFIFSGWGHSSLVEHVCNSQLDACIAWMNITEKTK